MSKSRLPRRENIRERQPKPAVVISVALHGLLCMFLLMGVQKRSHDKCSASDSPIAATAVFKQREWVARTHDAGGPVLPMPAPKDSPERAVKHTTKKAAARRELVEEKRIKKVLPSKHEIHAAGTSEPSDAPITSSTSNVPTSEGALLANNSENTHASLTTGKHELFRPSPLLLNGNDVKVSYPERARMLMVEGIVRLRLTVSETGRVIDVEILSGPAFGLRAAALMVARKLFFLPATDMNGKAMIAQVDHDVIFKLNKPSI